MNWLAVVEALDRIVKLRKDIVEKFPREDMNRFIVDQHTQVLQAISLALKEGLRKP